MWREEIIMVNESNELMMVKELLGYIQRASEQLTKKGDDIN